jgi:outer membrane protein insertion porin family
LPQQPIRTSDARTSGNQVRFPASGSGEITVRGQDSPIGGRPLGARSPGEAQPGQQVMVPAPAAPAAMPHAAGLLPPPPVPTVVQPGFAPPPIIGGPPGPLDGVAPPEPFEFIDIDTIVHEARTGRLMVGAGINSDAGLVGQVTIDEQNFDWTRFPRSWDDIRNGTAWRGAGQRFRIEAMPGTHIQRYLVSFQEPYLFDTPVSLGLSGFLYDRRYFDWEESRVGGRLAFGYQFPNDWSANLAFRLEEIEIDRPRIIPAVPELAEVLGSNTLQSVKVAVAHDTRDSAFLPTQGHLFEMGFEQVFGSFEYPIFTGEYRHFFTLSERIDGSGRHVVSVGGQVGFTNDAPVYDHFYAGGFSTIRGFSFRGASPKNNTVVVGGEFMLLTTLEYMFPITADDMLRAVVFVDAGTVEEEIDIEWDDFRVAPGFGLRIAHPGLGPAPIALDLAFPMAHETGDNIRNFTFFIGVRY